MGGQPGGRPQRQAPPPTREFPVEEDLPLVPEPEPVTTGVNGGQPTGSGYVTNGGTAGRADKKAPAGLGGNSLGRR